MTVAPIPADRRRYPPDCPDPDWCRGNRSCYWRCQDDGEPPPEPTPARAPQ